MASDLGEGSSSQTTPVEDEELGAANDISSAVSVTAASASTGHSSERRSSRDGLMNSIVKKRKGTSTLSGTSTSKSSVRRMWDDLTRPKNVDDFMDDDDYDDEMEKKSRPFHSSCKYLWINCFNRLKVAARKYLRIIKAHPYIPIVTFLFFASLCAASIGTTLVLAKNYKEEKKQVANHYGIMGRQLLKDQMDTTLESLHALMHGIHEDPILRDLPFRLGVAGEPGSAPLLSHVEDVHVDEHSGESSHEKMVHGNDHAVESLIVRNVTGICDDPSLVADFETTADVVRHAAYLHGVVIHHATLLPYGVVCLSNPSLETSGYHLGQDLFEDPHHSASVEKAISSVGALFSGPVQISGEPHGSAVHGDSHDGHDDHHSDHDHDSDGNGDDHKDGGDGHDGHDDHHSDHDHDSDGNDDDHKDEDAPVGTHEHLSHHEEEEEEAEERNSTHENEHLHAENEHGEANLDHNHDSHGDSHLDEGQESKKDSYNIWLMHIPIAMPSSMGYAFDNHWGILEVSVDWDEFLRESGIRPFFQQHDGLGFAIKRDHLDASQSTFLAMSEGADDIDPNFFIWLELDYRDTDERWALGVGVMDGYRPQWFGLGIGMSIFLSLLVTLLFLFSLVTWQGHKDFLLRILPSKAIQKIQRGEVYAEKFDMVTIFFSDIVGYTKLSTQLRPNEIMKMLDGYFSKLDELSKKHQVYKVETIGDAYMCVAGCPDRCMGPLGAQRISMFALDAIEMTKNYRLDDGSRLLIRCGINSGRVMAGVIGQIKPHFSLFGDTVNTASRMESTSETMKIHCSDATYRLLRDAPDYNFIMTERGSVQVKGKGEMNTWFICGSASRDNLETRGGSDKSDPSQSS